VTQPKDWVHLRAVSALQFGLGWKCEIRALTGLGADKGYQVIVPENCGR